MTACLFIPVAEDLIFFSVSSELLLKIENLLMASVADSNVWFGFLSKLSVPVCLKACCFCRCDCTGR
jgi:hypothetical protein